MRRCGNAEIFFEVAEMLLGCIQLMVYKALIQPSGIGFVPFLRYEIIHSGIDNVPFLCFVTIFTYKKANKIITQIGSKVQSHM